MVKVGEFIHFACTSGRISTTCPALMCRTPGAGMLPGLDQVVAKLRDLARAPPRCR